MAKLNLCDYVLDFLPKDPQTPQDIKQCEDWMLVETMLTQQVDKMLRNRDKARDLMDSSGPKPVLRSCAERIQAGWNSANDWLEEARKMVSTINKARIAQLHAELENIAENASDAILGHLDERQHEMTTVPSPRDVVQRMTSTPAPPKQSVKKESPHPQHTPETGLPDSRDRPCPRDPDPTERYEEEYRTDREWEEEGSVADTSQIIADAFGAMSKTLEQLVSTSDLPKEPSFIFDGSPWQYMRFVKDFDEKIGNKQYTDNKKINQLILGTAGKAREAIEPYQGMKDGYVSARRVLKERFGQPYQIVRSCVQRLTSGTRLKGNDIEGLRKFSDRLSADYRLLDEMNFLSEADNQTTLRAIFQQLPPGVQSRWVEKANKIEDENRYPKLKDLVEFLDAHVKKINHPVFQVTSAATFDSGDRRHNVTRPQYRSDRHAQGERPHHQRQSSTFSTQRLQPRIPDSSSVHSSVTSSSLAPDGSRSNVPHWQQPQRTIPVTSTTAPHPSGGNRYQRQAAPPRSQDNRTHSHRPNDTCLFCQRNHRTVECPVLETKDSHTRRQFAIDKRLCFACGYPHMIRECAKKNEPCTNRDCNGHHHRVFCNRNLSSSMSANQRARDHTSSDQSAPADTADVIACIQFRHSETIPKVLLRVVPVHVTSSEGLSLTTFALLDGGSTSTLMAKAFAERISAHGRVADVCFDTILKGDQQVQVELIDCQIAALPGRGEDKRIHLHEVEVVSQLHIDARYIHDNLDFSKWQHLKDINTDVKVDYPAVSLCIGQDNPETQVIMETCYGKDVSNEPYAVRTPFGWTVAGPTRRKSETKSVIAYVSRGDQFVGQSPSCCPETSTDSRQIQLVKLEKAINRFWDEDRHGFTNDDAKTLSQEDKLALSILKSSCRFTGSNYEIGMLWRTSHLGFPDNYSIALRCLNHVKKRFEDDPEFERMYRESMDNFIKKGYARKLTPQEASQKTTKTWILSHHGVQNPNKPGKVRVVKIAALQVNGISLNRQLMHGPDINNTLIGVLLRFRQAAVAISADIEEMFLRVLVPEEDTDALRFLWWDKRQSVRDPPSQFKMTRHIFGATDSPTACVFALQQCARDNTADFDKETIDSVLKNFYVDDLLKSTSSVTHGVHLAKQLIALLERGGFKLTKFISNRAELLAALPEELVSPTCRELLVDFESLPIQRALGIKWDVTLDEFGIKITLLDRPSTRRGCMSFVCSITDPFGVICPVTLVGKQIQQETCRRKLELDDSLPDDWLQRWEKWKASLVCLNDFSFPRCYAGLEDPTDIKSTQLHTFCDASETGYGTVSYLRVERIDGRIYTSFVMGKGRTAPLRYIGIPRAEFQAATVAARVSKLLHREIEISIDRTVFWSDSELTIKIIRNNTKRFTTFFAHRKEEILDASSPDQWKYCPTKLNPSDLSSRGVPGDKFMRQVLWMNGPPFLSQPENHWPATPRMTSLEDTDHVVKKNTLIAAVIEILPSLDDLITRYSDWTSLVCACAWIRKYIEYLRAKLWLRKCMEAKAKRLPGPESRKQEFPSMKLVVADIDAAEEAIVRMVQRDVFSDEIESLSKSDKDAVHISSSIRDLRPILINSTLRVGGRLAEAPLALAARHPMIVPKNHVITKLLIRHYHGIVAHAGVEHTLSRLREKFWIPNAKSAVKAVTHNCVHCRKIHGIKMSQIMANLPVSRLTPYFPPFTVSGLDCFGPVMVKRGRTEVKRYGLLVTCFSSRAVHLEMLDSLSTDSFVNALRRFIGRRGPPKELYCDNGTNIVGGYRELRRATRELNHEHITTFLRHNDTNWHFQTPTASHMCGVWERLIRSTKRAMKAVLKNVLVTDEVLRTVFVEVETVLNSRPLTANSDDPDDYEPLTPQHFLLQRRVDIPAPGDFVPSDIYRRQWRVTQILVNHFWKRWIREYLPNLQRLSKWRRERRDAQVGDLVLLAEKNLVRGKWPLGRVVTTKIGRDGHVRTVDVRTQSGVYTRPIHHLCLLEGASASPISVSPDDSAAGGV